ncbi:hypothetical protein [Roseixanthobacter glucoisosaccharinicivorans]|uniref:hypothetical protein n=1 Tax=Roseixanthobacter glucoisosaccharinicivorans TaxID=3119923 RepID=UPI00372CA9FE
MISPAGPRSIVPSPMESHDFDPGTAFCLRCGCHRNMVLRFERICIEAPNVVAMSHLRARARMREALAGKAGTARR